MSKINSIKVKQLSKIFETKNGGFEALSDVNLEVKKGDFVSIIGPSGCGKTTLMRCLSNLEDASNGSIEINGKTPVVVNSKFEPLACRFLTKLFNTRVGC